MDQDPAFEDESEPADRRTLPLVQLIPNLVTLLGLCAGLTAIRYGIAGSWQVAAGLIVLAALIDGMDGLLARKLNAASHFGAELDSLSDFVCFGVAPGIVIYSALLQDWPGLGWVLVLVYVLGACLRLARFNVNRNAPPPPGRVHFVGVPAPAGAMLGLLPLYLTLAGWMDMREWPALAGLYMAFVGLLMISRLPTPSPKGWRVPRKRAALVLVGVAVYAGALVSQPWVVLAVSDLAYLAVLAWGSWRDRRKLA
ncbi:CDP-diacylglycerol--serine O-phosphatidyltransferase [Pararhodobacter aggregans]